MIAWCITRASLWCKVTEGLDVLAAIDAAFVDGAGRPLQNVRIRHTIVLDDPFNDPPQLAEHIPDASPAPVYEQVCCAGHATRTSCHVFYLKCGHVLAAFHLLTLWLQSASPVLQSWRWVTYDARPGHGARCEPTWALVRPLCLLRTHSAKA